MLTYLRKKMKTIMIVVVFVFAASMFYGISMTRWRGGGGRVKGLAKVNGAPVDAYRYREILSRLIRQFGEEMRPQDLAFIENLALAQTVDFMLILAEAKKKVRISGREVDLALDSIVKQEKFSSKKDLERALKRAGLSMRKFKEMIRDEMLVQKMVAKIRGAVKVTPDDLREVKASHILLTTEARASEILERVKSGGDFAVLARKHSNDPGSASKGGDLGYFTTGSMAEPFEKAAFALKVGEVSQVVKTQFGYHIITVTDARLKKISGEEKDIEKAALAEKQEKAFRKWFSELKSKAKVEIISPELKAHDLRFKGRIWEAIQEYKEAIAQNPANPYLHVFLGDAYGTVGKSDLAISEYERAIAVEGGNLELYIILAKAYEKAGKKDLAIKQYKRASLVAGDNKARHEHLLKIFEELKAWDQVKREKAEIARIEKKEKFEKELRGEE
ncbi:MAG: peptidylprolyl isomerase [Candidatus Margulisiibacteriota bacterium]